MNTMTRLMILSICLLPALWADGQTTPSATPSPTASASPTAANAYSPSPSPSLSSSPFAAASPGQWDPFADMQRMQTDMNQFFSRAMNQFGLNPNFLSMSREPGFASSIDVRDKGDHYEVHAYLPGIDSQTVKVKAESNNLLRVSASQSKQEKKNTAAGSQLMAEFGDYEQLVTLPQPARTKDMKIERRQNELVITIPKKT